MPSELIKILENRIALSQKEVRLITQNALERTYSKGDFFLQAPKVCHELGFVTSGILRYYTIDAEGNEATAMFIQENDFFMDLESYYNRTPSEGFIQAETEVRLVVFERAALDRLKSAIPGWSDAFKHIAQERLVSQLKFSQELIKLDARSSYALFLKHFPTIANRVPDGHLASFLGITKYTLSRIKKNFDKN